MEILESRGERYRPALWDGLVGVIRERPAAVLIDPAELRSASAFYNHTGVRALDEVVVLRTASLPGPEQDMTVALEPFRRRSLDDLLSVDHSTFTWLWRNSREEFEEYLDTPGVSVRIAVVDSRSVGYVGVTEFDGWGHIDRLAVRQEDQGRGYGAQLLYAGLDLLSERGARYVQVSTQTSNLRSQNLYRRFGFRQTRGGYKLYGLVLD